MTGTSQRQDDTTSANVIKMENSFALPPPRASLSQSHDRLYRCMYVFAVAVYLCSRSLPCDGSPLDPTGPTGRVPVAISNQVFQTCLAWILLLVETRHSKTEIDCNADPDPSTVGTSGCSSREDLLASDSLEWWQADCKAVIMKTFDSYKKTTVKTESHRKSHFGDREPATLAARGLNGRLATSQ